MVLVWTGMAQQPSSQNASLPPGPWWVCSFLLNVRALKFFSSHDTHGAKFAKSSQEIADSIEMQKGRTK